MHEDQNPSALLSFLDSLKYDDVAGDGTRTGMALREASRVRARFLLFLKFLKLTGGGACLQQTVMLWSPLLTSKLGGQGSTPGRTSTQGLKIIEEKGLPLD